MTILITGATGNVGRQVTEQLVRRGADVRALVRDPAKAKFPAGVEVVRGDLLDVDSLRSAFSGVSTPPSGRRCWIARSRTPGTTPRASRRT